MSISIKFCPICYIQFTEIFSFLYNFILFFLGKMVEYFFTIISQFNYQVFIIC